MKAQAVKEHLFAEDVHFFNSDEQRGHTGPNDGTRKRSLIIYIMNYICLSRADSFQFTMTQNREKHQIPKRAKIKYVSLCK